MALMRKTACLLTILFAAIATIFLLVYPVFMESTRAELEFAYDSIEVTGWILNGRSYDDPTLRGDLWHPILDTGNIARHYTYSTMEISKFEPEFIRGKLDENAPEEEQLTAFNDLVSENRRQVRSGNIQGINVIEACEDLFRQKDTIQWKEGYSESCFAGNERVCLMAAYDGYELGERVPFRMENISDMKGVFWLEVVGLYSISAGGADMIVPLQTLEDLCLERQDWIFWVNGFSFLVKDNRQLPALKDAVLAQGLDGKNTMTNARLAIDDRILDGTVSPIKGNLGMLEGLYIFFFLVVAAIGFFLCFLLARGRKQEYAVMRLLGENSTQITLKALLEQFLLCVVGIALGAGVLAAVGQGAPDLVTCGIILVCYTLGAAIAVMLTVRVNVMEILRDKE